MFNAYQENGNIPFKKYESIEFLKLARWTDISRFADNFTAFINSNTSLNLQSSISQNKKI
jgi:hypothetical protein